MMRLLRPTAALSLLRSRTGLAILASRATHALHPHSGIFLRSFRLWQGVRFLGRAPARRRHDALAGSGTRCTECPPGASPASQGEAVYRGPKRSQNVRHRATKAAMPTVSMYDKVPPVQLG